MAEIENLKIGNGTIHIVGNQDIVADSWEAGKTYVADRSYVIREHILYVCNTTHTSVEPFDPTKWTATTIGEALGMAGSANVIECTLAEYIAWKAGGLLINETTYILTDAPNLNATSEDLSYDGGATSTHDVIENIGSYSTTEKAIGTWTDGSTVYKKTVKSTSITSNSLNNIAHGITGLNRLIDISGNCIRADNVLMPIPRITSDGTNGLISVSSVGATNIVLYVGFNYTGTTAISEVALTLIYTKT